MTNWDVILNNYDYPKRPCDTKCMDGCPARLNCPLFRAWESRTKRDKKEVGDKTSGKY